jgi:hypothetical protein
MDRVPHLHLLELGRDGRPARVRDLFEGTPYELQRTDPTPSCFDVSPDGRRVVFAFDPAPRSASTAATRWPRWTCAAGRIATSCRTPTGTSAPRATAPTATASPSPPAPGLKHTMPDQLAVWDRDRPHLGRRQRRVGPRGARAAAVGRRRPGAAVHRRAERPQAPVALRPARPPRRGGGGRRLGAGLRQARRHPGDAGRRPAHPGRLHAHLPGAAPRRIEHFNDSCWPLAAGPHRRGLVRGCAPAAGRGRRCRCG